MTPPRPAAGQRPSPRAGRLPAQLKPMLATAAVEPFDSPEHIFELKLDGVRALAFLEAGEVRVQNRRLEDVRAQFPQFADVPRRVKAKGAVLDGEIVAPPPAPGKVTDLMAALKASVEAAKRQRQAEAAAPAEGEAKARRRKAG